MNPPNPMLNRRRDNRANVDIVLNAYQDGLPGIAFADNISVSGIRLRRVLEPRLRRADQIELEFQLPNDGEIIYVTGQRVYEDDMRGHVGIRFLDLSDRHFDKLQAYIDENPTLH